MDDGWDVEAVAAALHQTAPRLAYLVPDFHNPTGLLAGSEERAGLAEALRRTRTPVVIDETLAELALDTLPDGDPPRPFAAFLPSAITIGSTSKAFWGGLRVGWIRADPALVQRLAAVRASSDMSTALLEQLAVTELLDRADELLSARRVQLRERRDVLVSALARHLPDWQVRVPSGGLVLWCDLGEPASSRLVVAAEHYDVRLAAGPRFGVDGAFERRIRVPYSYPVDVLERAAGLLAQAFRAATATPTTPEHRLDAFA